MTGSGTTHFRSPLMWWIFSLFSLYVILALLTEARALLIYQNVILAALSSGVIVAYAPAAYLAITCPEPRQGELLSLGIFLGWISVFALRVLVIARFGFYTPDNYVSDLSTAATFPLMLSAICHLAAPEAINGWAPRRTWAVAGSLIAVGLILGALLLALTN